MIYFKNTSGDIYGYDEMEAGQQKLIDEAKNAGWLDVTANWPPVPSLEKARAAKLAELNAAFTTASETARCLSSAGFEINADETANRNISSLIVAMEATGGETVRFCAFDNCFHDVTLAQLKTMQLEIIANAQAIYQQKWVLREQINSAETVEELDTIDITFEEPEESDGQTV